LDVFRRTLHVTAKDALGGRQKARRRTFGCQWQAFSRGKGYADKRAARMAGSGTRLQMRLEIRHPRLGIGRGLNMPTKDAICFGCDTVQQIDATLSEASCKCGGNMRTLFSLEAFQIGRLAHRLGGRYYVHSSIIDVAASVDRSQPVDWANTREVERKDGTKHVFAFDHYLREAFENLKTKDDLNRVWIVGGLITLADALGKKTTGILTGLRILNLSGIFATALLTVDSG
jgi:hypothetical protein